MRILIPEKVTRVTKTQFTVESGDRYKKDGRKIGDSCTKAYKEGDDRGWYGKKILVCNETKQMEDFKLKLKHEREVNNMISELKINLNSELSLPELKDIVDKLESIKKIIESKNN